jgi:WD40 repeat protein
MRTISVIILFTVVIGFNVAYTQDKELEISTEPVRLVEWHPNNDLVANVGFDQGSDTIMIWDAVSGELIHQLGNEAFRKADIAGLDWSPDGEHIAALYQGYRIVIWDVLSGQISNQMDIKLQDEVVEREYLLGQLSALDWSPYGSQIAVVEDGYLDIWNFASETFTSIELPIIDGFQGAAGVAWSPDGSQIAVIAGEYNLVIFDSQSLQIDIVGAPSRGGGMKGVVGRAYGDQSIAWSADGTKIASYFSSFGNILVADLFVWNAQNGLISTTLDGFSSEIQALDWNSTGEFLAIATGSSVVDSTHNEIYIYDMNSNDIAEILQEHTDTVTSVSWSPDGMQLASGSLDGTIRIWDIPEGQ